MSVTTRFGPYELVHRLGQGGMAETFVGIRRGPGGFEQHVCLKRILPAFEANPKLIEQFMLEARLAAQLRHANIAQVVDFGEVDGSHYLALELVDGIDLRALQKRLVARSIPFDPSLVVLVGLALSAALEVAHHAGRTRPPVIHRDISPSNVLVSRRGEIYLTDFGVARPLGVERGTDAGVIRGKIPYMAPEYVSDGRFDARTDLFAVGVVLYEALAGRRPFDGVNELDTLQRITAGRHAPLGPLAPGAPPGLVAVVEQLIKPGPEDRPQSAAALTEALAPFAPPATASRTLGDLVRSSGESLSQSLQLSPPQLAAPSSAGPLSAPHRTAALALDPAPSYPDVSQSAPDVVTRTSDAGRAYSRIPTETAGAWSATDPSRLSQPGPWASTDPSQISHHDRPSPYDAAAAALAATDIPPTAPSLPVVALPDAADAARAASAEPQRSRGCLWAAVAVLGFLAFLGATGGAYLLVRLFSEGAG